jgi:hypothetical protein
MKQKQTGITVFFSYAQADQSACDQLVTHLSQLKRDGLIEEWSYQQILAGSDRTQEILQMLHSAQIVLLLISADFLASDACYHIEMQQALERHRRGEARVIPIIVRPCDWEHSPFAHLQCLPRNTKPITTWNNRDEAFVAIVQELRKVIVEKPFLRPPLSGLQSQNRARLLKRVRKIWIEGLLDQSLHRTVWIDLHLQEQPDALENPWRFQVQELDQAPHALPLGTSVVEVYDEADGELLILGEPGSGKTTLLLQLARTLLDRAEADEQQRMPVVFHLSSWAQKKEAFALWLVKELKTKYQVPLRVAQHWLDADQVLPLLDGLDEVPTEAQVACVQAITAYYHHPSPTGTSLVVCCRSEEYRALSLHLPLQHAVSILPLTRAQIDTYFSTAQGQLEGLRQALHDDAEFYELACRPLMLSIFTLAYQGVPSVNLPIASTQERTLQAVFDSYVKHMLARRGQLRWWKQKQFLHWLICLAKQLHRRQQTVYSVEDLQPDWLPGNHQRLYRWSLSLLFGLVGGLLFGLAGGLLFGPIFGLSVGLQKKIQPAEMVTWSWKPERSELVAMLVATLLSMLAGWLLFIVLLGWEPYVLLGSLAFALFSGLLSGKQLVERAALSPNEGIWRSGKNALVAMLFTMLFCVLLVGLIILLFTNQHVLLSVGLVRGLLFVLVRGLLIWLFIGLPIGLFTGLNAFIQHFALRFWLWRLNDFPWKVVPLLDEAADRLLLYKVGGNYVFVHRLLLEYFATLDEPAPTKRIFPEGKR